MTPFEQLIHEYEVERPNPFYAEKLKRIVALERQEQAQERAQDRAEIYDLEGECTRLNANIMQLELELQKLKGK